jgi:hypothetical protein
VLPCAESPLEAEVDLVHGVELRVVGPHVEEHLRNVLYVIFNQSRPEGIAADCKFPRMYSVGKDLQERNFVMEGLEKGVEAQVTGEIDPLPPGFDAARCVARRDSLEDGCLSNAKVTAEMMCLDGVQI